MSELSDEGWKTVNVLLEGSTDLERREAAAALRALPDRDDAADYLVDLLKKEDNYKKRFWIVSGLAAINKPDTVDTVAERLDPEVEPEPWVRYWAAIGLAQMEPDDLAERLAKTAENEDEDCLVQAVALRLLIENGVEGDYVEQLLAMAQAKAWRSRWAACKVLRCNAGHQPLPNVLESEFRQILQDRLHDSREVMDTRYQAALALGNMTHEPQKAIDALSRALSKRLPDYIRRSCVDALAQIAQPETKEALLGALVDGDAEIRVRAANALKDTLGEQDAASFIGEQIFSQEEPPLEYFDALRQIGDETAASVLATKLVHPDPLIGERASRALARLGGEHAVRTLQAQRTEALKTYTRLLGGADMQVMQQFNTLMGKAHQAFTLSMWMHGIVFAVGVGAIIAGLAVALWEGLEAFERFVGVGMSVGGLGTLLYLFYTDPLINIRQSVVDLIRVNVVFLGYVRQINQIDATFKQMFLSAVGFGVKEMQQTVQQIQKTVSDTLAEIKDYLKST